ncbi:hypothetical protein GWI33_019875 [Rhynchophorus ferrugineus]|uniref:Uncharacterized protein n=1 Tax=Rhynchophorus ferrugineus TaxID=354439 RepID=A0A834M4U6_RHYFE|nr:hypothetical protein GWI33_019875 [Rhynchophorus ferrugineus]
MAAGKQPLTNSPWPKTENEKIKVDAELINNKKIISGSTPTKVNIYHCSHLFVHLVKQHNTELSRELILTFRGSGQAMTPPTEAVGRGTGGEARTARFVEGWRATSRRRRLSNATDQLRNRVEIEVTTA